MTPLERLKAAFQQMISATNFEKPAKIEPSDLILALAVIEAAQADLYTETAWLKLKDALQALTKEP